MSDKLPADSYAQRMRDQEGADSDTGLDFGQALAALKAGKRVRRATWGSVANLVIDKVDKMFTFRPGDCDDCQWCWEVSDEFFDDIVANDWQVIP